MGEKIPVSVVTVTPHNESTINQKEQEYISKNLGNLFFAIYDINLQEDILHMVSQREEVKDILKMEMSFTEAIDIYSRNFVHSDFREEYVRKMSRSNLMEKLNENCPFAAIEYRRVKKLRGDTGRGRLGARDGDCDGISGWKALEAALCGAGYNRG